MHGFRTLGVFSCVLALAVPALAGKLRIVTTTSDLRSIAEAVGGDKVEVTSLGSGREDPHFIDAKPSSMLQARDADLWIRVGLELEIGYEGLILDGSHNPKIRVGTPGHLDASAGVPRLEVPGGKIDRSMGDVHPQGNPHYWLDPLNARIVAKNIAARLGELDAADANYFADRLKAFQSRLDEAMFGTRLIDEAAKVAGSRDQAGAKLWAMELKGELDAFAQSHGANGDRQGWWGKMRALKGTKVLTYHRSWSYFTNRFGLKVVAELEPKPGIEPSPGHLADVVKIVESEKAKFLLMEPFYSRQAPDWLASNTGIAVVNVANSVGGQPEAADYVALIDLIVSRCVAAAGK
ncbi:MAG: metal ABC transporter substrate-binding protein [Phycisphaerae bacterium]